MISPTFNIGPFTVHYYGLIIAVAVFIGWTLAKKRASKYRIPEKIFDDPILFVILALALTGARLYHVLDYWDYYSQNFLLVFYIQNGGLGIWGGLLGGLLGAYFVTRVKKLPILGVLDLTVPYLALGQAIGRIGNYINQEGFGPPTSMPWGVFISPQKRPFEYIEFKFFHPTFFYEAILDLVVFGILIYFAKKSKIPGHVFALYLVLYPLSRFFIEFYRIDTWTIGTIKIAQFLAIMTLFLGLYLFYVLKKKALT
ncbi:MAG: Prolipoprotein diacylglyceryl transferase [Candidatus Curtissbacteria bacterium GW2011_GWA1_40_16]|uniref:Phosphatidylglycerol--prolipoprotein diacylglyceryl transferase n=1 Tax=Candidatus Curtissbacteria bacterium GW2011_GWA1_40_16 TaxID=1618405 RepID=A0A0G0UMC4_9BACT|nr:MAG: Prolipoprotein diacylglyceryl transferase [Candidatus Curtissbacteria bacterium GW2011_GWA1_40_16]